MAVIEMNPRVSRSSALASKATGFPIAKIAAKLSVGYTLDEITNDITQETFASFEPTIDYVVTKVPRFTFEKFPQAEATLTTQMKSVGEAMAIGRTFKESLQKALRSLEIGSSGFESRLFPNGIDRDVKDDELSYLRERLRTPNWERLWYLADALRVGLSLDEIHNITNIDPWFLFNLEQIVNMESDLQEAAKTADGKLEGLLDNILAAKKYGFSDQRLAFLLHTSEECHPRIPLGKRHPTGLQAGSIPAAANLKRSPLIFTPPTKKSAKPGPRIRTRS